MKKFIVPIMAVAGTAMFIMAMVLGTQDPTTPPLAFYFLAPIGTMIMIGSVPAHVALTIND